MTRRTYAYALLLLAGVALAAFAGWVLTPANTGTSPQELARLLEEQPSSSSPRASVAMKRDRWEYFFRMQRDPATNRIPSNIRARELAYAQTLPARTLMPKDRAGLTFDWSAAGPNDVGGRTRALGIDQRDPDVVIAGGVSGGIWKSTDGARTWAAKNTTAQRLSVTSLAQDPTQPDVWYYGTGEWRGNSASDRGFQAPFRGNGIYKSTDNGETWSVLQSTFTGNTATFNSPFQYIARVVVSPVTGTLLVATNRSGLFRSTDGGATFEQVLTAGHAPIWSEVAVASDGTLLATLSTARADNPQRTGLFLSRDDGVTWTDITPSSFPLTHRRSVAAFAPSDPAIAYVATTLGSDPGEAEDARLYAFDFSADTIRAADRSQHLPAFQTVTGRFNTQIDYNMEIAVKPDDPNFVVLGGRNLYRSDDGFRSELDRGSDWIGGYRNDVNGYSLYPTHHPDQHTVAFDPTDPSRMWSGNDGGVYVTEDVVTPGTVRWSDRNSGYIVTQFYTVALPSEAGDPRIAGGTQDNGTPFFRLEDTPQFSVDISGADGSHLYFGEEFAYTSTQRGRVIRQPYTEDGRPFFGTGAALVTPESAEGRLFIHPFAVDPSDESVMYYPGGEVLWRTTTLDLPVGQPRWDIVEALPRLSDCLITTLAASRKAPRHTLYVGASCGDRAPRLFRIDQANSTAATATEISIPASAVPDGQRLDGAYVHRIAVAPDDGNTILVMHSNYNITGLYHSSDGGASFTAVEGNLAGGASGPGPSLRSAVILPQGFGAGYTYVVGTSTGLYATSRLDGSDTVWEQEADASVGNAVVEFLDARPSDRRVAVASHGRGLFTGEVTNRPDVVFARFDAIPGDNAMLLAWETTFERDNEAFEVEMRPVGPSETAEWEPVTTVAGAGSGVSQGAKTYRHRIPFLLPGTYAFRVRQVSLDGSSALVEPPSFQATVRVSGSHELTAAWPNPMRERAQFALSVAEPQEVEVVLYDVQGRRVRTLFTGALPADQARTIYVDRRGLASGSYFYRAIGETFAATGRLTLVR